MNHFATSKSLRLISKFYSVFILVCRPVQMTPMFCISQNYGLFWPKSAFQAKCLFGPKLWMNFLALSLQLLITSLTLNFSLLATRNSLTSWSKLEGSKLARQLKNWRRLHHLHLSTSNHKFLCSSFLSFWLRLDQNSLWMVWTCGVYLLWSGLIVVDLWFILKWMPLFASNYLKLMSLCVCWSYGLLPLCEIQ